MRKPSPFVMSLSFLLAFFLVFERSKVIGMVEYTKLSTVRLERIQEHLRKINKPAVRSIQSPDGDTIDCVPKHKQPALDHPLLKNHKIQTKAPQRPKLKGDHKTVLRNFSTAGSTNRGENKEKSRRAWQMWHHVGHCPRGTIPMRRSTINDVLRAKSLHHYGKKHGKQQLPLARKVDAPDVISGNGHEHAIAYTGSDSQEIYGAEVTMNVWGPSVFEPREFSLSQIWILGGKFNESCDLNSIEAGWQVSPDLYGDSRPRLFTYWTSDAYQATGCYNLLCSGFVQTNNRIAIGAAISPVSSFDGNQYDISILVWKDPKLGNWWMSFGGNMLVGYWPAELFTHLKDHAAMVEWGGEVVNSGTNGEHTRTQMGSGHFADEGFARACYMRGLKTVDVDNNLIPVESLSVLAENTNCYNIQSFTNAEWGTYFYYGGPGKNPACN